MKLLLLIFLLLSSIAYAQDDSERIYRERRDSIKLAAFEKSQKLFAKAEGDSLVQDREGKGNSSFILSVHFLETLIVSRATVRRLEQDCGEWSTNKFTNQVDLEWNDRTQNHDIPCYIISYETDVKGRHYTITVETNGKSGCIIKKLTVVTVMNGISVAEFKESLHDRGYLVNENLTEIFHRQTWQNKNKKVTMILGRDGYGSFSAEVF